MKTTVKTENGSKGKIVVKSVNAVLSSIEQSQPH
jgi:hypothetical protein